MMQVDEHKSQRALAKVVSSSLTRLSRAIEITHSIYFVIAFFSICVINFAALRIKLMSTLWYQ